MMIAEVMFFFSRSKKWSTTYKDYARPGTAFDELAIWTRALKSNKTHNEMDYFLGGYGEAYLYLHFSE